jgi:hypothetical protein
VTLLRVLGFIALGAWIGLRPRWNSNNTPAPTGSRIPPVAYRIDPGLKWERRFPHGEKASRQDQR